MAGLLGAETLEVVRLDAMRSKHGLLGCCVLGHKIMIHGEVHVSRCLQLLIRSLRNVSITLLFGHLGVSVLHGFLYISASLCMGLLSLVKNVVEVFRLLIMSCISESRLVLVKGTFANLLIDPVLLL